MSDGVRRALETQTSTTFKPYLPPPNNAPTTPSIHGVFYLGDAHVRPPSNGETWTSEEYARLVRLTVLHPVTKDHRWKFIADGLARNPDPSEEDEKERKVKEQGELSRKNKGRRNAKDVELEKAYYCHGCGSKNNASSTECKKCATPNVHRTAEECFLQQPALYHRYKEKILSIDFSVNLQKKLGPILSTVSLKEALDIAKNERAERRLYDESYCYGEMDTENLSKLLQALKHIYGHMPPPSSVDVNTSSGTGGGGAVGSSSGVFWDLGSGTGKCVLTAACAYDFGQVWGVEYMVGLHKISEDLLSAWKESVEYQDACDQSRTFKDMNVRTVCGDYNAIDQWIENTSVCLLHGTCLNDVQLSLIAEKAETMNIGTVMISVTRPLMDFERWFVIGEDSMKFSWGVGRVFIQEKISM